MVGKTHHGGRGQRSKGRSIALAATLYGLAEAESINTEPLTEEQSAERRRLKAKSRERAKAQKKARRKNR